METIFGTTRRSEGDWQPSKLSEERVLDFIEQKHGLRPATVVWLMQIHSDVIVPVQSGASGLLGEADGLMTAEPGIALTVRTADCAPVFIETPNRIALVHAGMAGALQEILPAAIRQLDASPDQVRITIGPHICQECYVMSENNQKLLEQFPRYRSAVIEQDGQQLFPVQKILEQQAHEAGVSQIFTTDECTKHSGDYYSSRNGDTEPRMLSYIVMRDA